MGAILVMSRAEFQRVKLSLDIRRGFTQVVPSDNYGGSRSMLVVACLAEELVFAAILRFAGHGVTGGRRIRVHSVVYLHLPIASIEIHAPSLTADESKEIKVALLQGGTIEGTAWSVFWRQLKRLAVHGKALDMLEERVADADRPIDTRAKEVHLLVRDSFGLAGEMGGFDRSRILDRISPIAPPESTPATLSFVQETAIEDSFISFDARKFPGLEIAGDSPSGLVTFSSKTGERLHVMNVNRTKRETTTGVDLIYIADSYESAVLVQYKMFNFSNDPSVKSTKAYYRLTSEDEAQCHKMLCAQAKLQTALDTGEIRDYRLGAECVFYKLCHRCEPDTPSDLVSGIYFSVEHWRRLLKDQLSTGVRGASAIGYETSDRHLSNTDFTALVRHGWIGSRATPVQQLQQIIDELLSENRSVTIARKTTVQPGGSLDESARGAKPKQRRRAQTGIG